MMYINNNSDLGMLSYECTVYFVCCPRITYHIFML